MKPKVGVVGLGAWGSALLLHLTRKGVPTIGWGRGVSNGSSKVTVGSSRFPLSPLASLTNELKDLSDIETLIVALPAKALNSVQIPKKTSLLVSATKGLEPHTLLTPLDYFTRHKGIPAERCCTLSGPSFAADLAAERPISVVAASSEITTAEKVVDLFIAPSMRVYSSDDPIGVELGGILKNVIALAAGVSDSLGLGPSGRAALITRGLAEITRLAVALGAQPTTLAGLSGLGDLIMTASDDQSRNRSVGLRLGKGETIEEITTSLGSVAEGVATAPLALKLAQERGIQTPICEQVVLLLTHKITPQEMVSSLMQRPRKKEF
jgi:glycerol-3-phosphate dehydrogenase (NAD(P)+)